MRARLALAAPALVLAQASAAEPPPLRIVTPTSQSMPLLRMEDHRPVDGILKDLGEALARRLGLSPVFVALPSKRVTAALVSGAADLLCHAKAEWLGGKLLWTQPFLSGAGVIAAGPDAPGVSRLQDLRDEALGTVLGYRYPVLDQAFEQAVRREDVADAETNLRRLALGRIRYAVTERAALTYYLRAHPAAGLRELMEVEPYQLGCALSPHRAELLPTLNQAIERMIADGTLDRLLNRYR
ncbi:hypothetical protein ASD88_24910 [Pelomonas sp. Root662]|nr:hypothetical protein ASC81_24955 [Pelomonas sp. Root405]KRA76427.1 hypothetical protein ASD88_24910 [Pelomonas sp. Root662]